MKVHHTNREYILLHTDQTEIVSVDQLRRHAASGTMYYQPWYHNQPFAYRLLPLGEYRFAASTHPKMPDPGPLPSAVACAALHLTVLAKFNKHVWDARFVWCEDQDTEGDQIYVGYSVPYGFQIHRHLKLKPYHQYVDFSYNP